MTMRPVREVVAGATLADHVDYRLPETDVSHIEAVLELLADCALQRARRLAAAGRRSRAVGRRTVPGVTRRSACWNWPRSTRGDITLTALGLRYVQAEQGMRQQIFGQQLLAQVRWPRASAPAWRTRTSASCRRSLSSNCWRNS